MTLTHCDKRINNMTTRALLVSRLLGCCCICEDVMVSLFEERELPVRVDGAYVGLEVVFEVGAVRAVGAAEGPGVRMCLHVSPQLPSAQEPLEAARTDVLASEPPTANAQRPQRSRGGGALLQQEMGRGSDFSSSKQVVC